MENELKFMNSEQLSIWFENMGLAKVAENIKNEKLTGDDFAEFEEHDYAQIGIPISGFKWKQFNRRLKKLKNNGFKEEQKQQSQMENTYDNIPKPQRKQMLEKNIVDIDDLDEDDRDIIKVLLKNKKTMQEIAKKIGHSEKLIQAYINSHIKAQKEINKIEEQKKKIEEEKKKVEEEKKKLEEEKKKLEETKKKKTYLHTIEFKSHKIDPWGCIIKFNDNINQWKITSIKSGQQAERLGVKIGYRVFSIDDEDINETNAELIKNKLRSGLPCKITFQNVPYDPKEFFIKFGVKKDQRIWNLNRLKIRDEDCLVLSTILKLNSVVTYLNVIGNKIGDTGATVIGQALEINSSIVGLSLDGNKIGDLGAIAIAESLKNNSTLMRLSLINNKIGDPIATVLGDTLKKNSSLKTIYLHSNELTSSGKDILREARKNNTVLKEFYLDNYWNPY